MLRHDDAALLERLKVRCRHCLLDLYFVMREDTVRAVLRHNDAALLEKFKVRALQCECALCVAVLLLSRLLVYASLRQLLCGMAPVSTSMWSALTSLCLLRSFPAGHAHGCGAEARPSHPGK